MINQYKAAIILTTIGAILLVVAIALPLVFPSIFESKLTQKLVIKPDSDMLQKFQKTPIPIYFQIWIFNVTNPKDVVKGKKAILQQVGPYTYRQQNERIGITWNHANGTVIFNKKKFYYFEPELSQGSESDLVITINPVFISLASKVSTNGIPPAIRAVAQIWFLRFGFSPFMTHTVGELLFEGYDEPLLKELAKLTKDPAHERAKFGFFYAKNGTEGPETEVFTGEFGMENYQNIARWKNQDKLNFWSKEHCNMLNGTDGSQFPRPINKNKPIFLFTAQLCRSIYAVYEKDVKNGPLTLHRFILPRELLADSEDNRCYCSSNFTCRNSMIDVSPCRKGSPVIISTPHFYQGDKDDQTMVDGLNPNKHEHETFLDIEPNTGVTMRVAKRIQINMPLRRFASFPSLQKVQEVVFPILWVNESAEVPVESANKLHRTLTIPLKAVTYGSWALLAIGIFLIILGITLAFKNFQRNKKHQNKRQNFNDTLVETKNTKELLEKNSY